MKVWFYASCLSLVTLGWGAIAFDNTEPPRPNFTLQDVFAAYKLQQRRACHRVSKEQDSSEGVLTPRLFSEPDAYNQLNGFLHPGDSPLTLDEIEALRLKSSRLEKIPWSGDYWPYSLGLLGNRFFDERFTKHKTWKERYDFVQANPAHDLVRQEGQDLRLALSVSEKYDYLSGDFEFPLTEQMWAKGRAIHDEKGEVEDWMGLCHGWAASAIMMQKPKKTVSLRSHNDRHAVVFFPDEIKALSSYSWAEARYPTLFTGRRCNAESPEREDRSQFPECEDLNPATWHQIVIYQIGRYQESFVVDATYDAEVWNHPVFAYSFEYYNPKTEKKAKTWRKAKTLLRDFKDNRSADRSPLAVSLVGVRMTLGLVVETEASVSEDEPDLKKRIHFVNYVYDLELDQRDQIVGGEWHTEDHPDFVWKPAKGATDRNALDEYVDAGELSVHSPLGDRWKLVMNRAASVGYILPSFVHFLIQQSQEKN